MDEKFKRSIQEEADKEADLILSEVNSAPGMDKVKAPEDIHASLMSQIRNYEAANTYAGLSEEDKELIELGKVYKRRRKWTKWFVIAAVLVMGMMFGMTSIGGAEKAMEKLSRVLGGREQSYFNSADERMAEVDIVEEEEAYLQIKNEFGFMPVKLDYLPEGMAFKESIIYRDTQTIRLIYENKKDAILIYSIQPDYRIGSISGDVEDILLNEYVKKVDGVNINVCQYLVEDDGMERWRAEFEYNNIYYVLQMYHLSDSDVDMIVDNLYFQ